MTQNWSDNCGTAIAESVGANASRLLVMPFGDRAHDIKGQMHAENAISSYNSAALENNLRYWKLAEMMSRWQLFAGFFPVAPPVITLYSGKFMRHQTVPLRVLLP